jgi:hypothetical protein
MCLLKESAFFLFKILYLPAVHSQGREDNAGVFSFINEWPDKFRFGPTWLHIHL